MQRQAVRGALPRGLGALVELYHVVRRGHSEQNLRHRDRGGDELYRAVLVERMRMTFFLLDVMLTPRVLVASIC